jgi:two-component system CheB/CheR fusion protein
MTAVHHERPTRALSPQEFAECIVDTVREPLVVLGADLRVRSANRSFYRSFGVIPEETNGRLVYELGNGQWNIPGLRTLLEEILPRDHSFRDFEVDHVFEGLGRRRMILNARKLWREGNETEMILLAIEDVTDRWRAEIELRDSRERYRLIVESATGYSIFTSDLRGLITTWNPGAERIFGYGEDEMIGADIRIIYTPEDRASGQADLEMRTAEAEGRALDERWHVKKGGEQFWADGLVMPLKDDADCTRGFLKILRDMTGQRQLEASLRQRTASLEATETQRNEFLAMLAHELRNPLAAISNAVALSAHQDTNQDLEWSRSVISRQVGPLSRLIDDLLDISRITHNKIQLRKEDIDASPVLRHAIEAVKPLAETRNQELTFRITSPDVRLHADPMRLEQIVVNLLTNAAKYTPPGGHSADTAIGMAKLLKRIGHDVWVAHDGPAAIESASAQRPEVVLLDIGLPDMDGFEVAARLRREEYGRKAILIAVSGYGGEPFAERMKEVGFDHHLLKPVDINALLTLLDRAHGVA